MRRERCRACSRRRKCDKGRFCKTCRRSFRFWCKANGLPTPLEPIVSGITGYQVRDWLVDSVDWERPEVQVAFDRWSEQRITFEQRVAL